MCTNNFRAAGVILMAALDKMSDVKAGASRQQGRSKSLLLQPVRVEWSHDYTAYQPYNWAFVVLDTDSSDEGCFESDLLISSVLLYNVALCYQALACSSSADEAYLKEALQVYDTALPFLDCNRNHYRLLRLAIINNRGYVLTRLGQPFAAQRCLRKLKYLLMTSDAPEEVQREDVLGLHLNVALVYKRHDHAAAA